MNRFEIPCENGITLVAERNPDPLYDREIYLFLMDTNTKEVTQGIAIVRQAFKTKNTNHVLDDYDQTQWTDKFEVLVYSDKDNEDYTHRFLIDRYEYKED